MGHTKMTVVKSGVMKIIRYGPYVRNGNNADKKLRGKVTVVCESWNEEEQQLKVEVTRDNMNYNCVVV